MEVQRSHISMYFMVILTALYPNLCSGADQTLNSVQSAKIPQQIHLSFGAQANDAVVVWATEGDEFGYVEYGSGVVPVKGVQGQKLELTEHSEKAVKFLHRAELSNLVRGTTYWYIIFSADSKVRSDNFTFRVPPKLSRVGHKFVVLADMGLLTRALQFMVHEILNGGYHAVFHIGDFAYNLDSEAGSIGDNYMRKISSFTARVPYMTTPGDHEKAYDFYHYRHRFSMPNAPWPMKEENLWYSINIGHTHFISINTQLDPGSRLGYMQRKWLKADLKTANVYRRAHPWIVVMGHKPMYCTKSVMVQTCDQAHSPLREQFEDLFFEQGVDLYISGHKHCYERSWPMYQGRVFQTDTIHPMAPIYIIIGAMGYEYLVDQQNSRPFWLAFGMSDGGKELYGRMTVINATHLIWSVHAAASNEEVDNIQIVQRHHRSFGKAGLSAFSKIQVQSNKGGDLPPEPFFLVDAETDNHNRRVMLYIAVFMLSFILVMFVRSTRVRKALRLCQ